MTRNARKFVLLGYLAVAIPGIVYVLTSSHELLALLQSAAARQQPLSWPLVLGMGIFVLLFAGTVFFSMPTNPLFYFAAGYLFGFVTGSVLAVIAATLGSVASLYFFRETTSSSPALQTLNPKNVFLTLVLLRCSPWFPSPLINVFCAVARVPFSIFLVSTVFGTLPLVSCYTFFASRLRGPITVSILHSPELLWALTIFSVISLLGFLQPLQVVISHLRGAGISTSKLAS